MRIVLPNAAIIPYLYKPDLVSRTIAMIDRTLTCPIVYEVLEELKKSLRFRPR